MSRLQTLRMIACMLLMGVVAIAAYLFYQHSLYFCLFFSLMIMQVLSFISVSGSIKRPV